MLINWLIPDIIPVVIPPVNQMTMDGVAASGSTLHAIHAVLHTEIVTGAARSAARVLKDPLVLNWKDVGRTNPQDRNTLRIPPRATTPVRIGTGTSVPPIIIRSQEIEGPRRSIINQEVRNSKPLETSINRISSKNRDPTPTWSKSIGRKFTNKSSADVYTHGQMSFASDTVLSESRNFMDLGMSSDNTTHGLGSVFAPTIKIVSAMHIIELSPA